MNYLMAYQWKDFVRFKVSEKIEDCLCYIGHEDRHLVSNVAVSIRTTFEKGYGYIGTRRVDDYLKAIESQDWGALVETFSKYTDDEFDKAFLRHVLRGDKELFKYRLIFEEQGFSVSEDNCSLYLIADKKTYYVKVGVAGDVEKRFTTLKTASPHDLVILCEVKMSKRSSALELEKYLHNKYSNFNTHGEWFYATIIDDIVENDFKNYRFINK